MFHGDDDDDDGGPLSDMIRQSDVAKEISRHHSVTCIKLSLA